tara:strand:+ start:51 stop:374 length:324 start_codon:yes stop_codon:yes gene_type:complete
MYGDPRYHPYIIYGDPNLEVAIQNDKSADCLRQIWLLNPKIRRYGPHYNNMKQPQMSVGKYYQRQGLSQNLFLPKCRPPVFTGDPAIRRSYRPIMAKYIRVIPSKGW